VREKLRVAVVGGGLAGLQAALECADAGAAVTLFEARPRLGGATFSVRHDGYWLDNGQHVALRCCTDYFAFLRRLGVEDRFQLQGRMRIPVLSPRGGRATLARTSLPAPLHLAPTLLRYRHLDLRERVAAARAAAALRKLDPADPRLDTETFGDWLRARGQSAHSVRNFWNLIALPTLNLGADEASLALAVKVFRTGLLDAAEACDIGIPTIPLQQLHGDAAAAALERSGARVAVGKRVHAIEQSDGALRLHVDRTFEEADAVVVAVPHDAVARLLPEATFDAGALSGLGASPIVNLHFHYDRIVLGEPFSAVVDSPLQWLFDRTASSGIASGQLVGVSISGAEREISETRAALRLRYEPALQQVLPAARDAVLLDFTVTREPRATFRGTPGSGRLRPGPRTTVPGLFLAGAWTDTGWPATMEGAVRSGLTAARALLAASRPDQVPLSERLEPVA
jgi:hydroxysqualene dehydroxylase